MVAASGYEEATKCSETKKFKGGGQVHGIEHMVLKNS